METWSDEALRASVNAYQGMQTREDEFRPYNKRETFRQIVAKYGKDHETVESGFKTISAALRSMDRTWIPGIEPGEAIDDILIERIRRIVLERDGINITQAVTRPSYVEKMPEIRNWLIQVAKRRGVVKYGDLMTEFDVGFRNIRRVMDFLGHQSDNRDEPILTALIVNSSSGRCSEGFAKEFAVIDDNAERENLYLFWSDQSSTTTAVVKPFQEAKPASAGGGQSGYNVLRDLRPREKLPVYDLLNLASFNTEAWETDAQGMALENPAVNGRAYAWSFFDQDSLQHIFMLWHEDMEVVDDAIRYRQRWDSVVRDLEKTRPQTAARADAFLRHISKLKIGDEVRVGVLEGSRGSTSHQDASRVKRRNLDGHRWHLSHWDPLTSTYEFTRGQFSAPGESVDVSNVEVGLVDEDLAHRPTRGDDEIVEDPQAEDIEQVRASSLSETARVRLINARLGQGRFRMDVLARWENSCAVTGSPTLSVIRSSHCKPWRSSSNDERLNPCNGLPLVATLDALFDCGLITFDDSGLMVISDALEDVSLSLEGLRLRRRPTSDEAQFIRYHRDEIFIQ